MAAISPYQYTRLPSPQHTRLLRLDPGDGRGVLRCSLYAVDLSAKPIPVYAALSYVWGSGLLDKPLLISGPKGEKDSEIKITPSLDAALRRFQMKERERYLWADAVCIDQQDKTGEKEQQVSIMGDIYRKAAGIFVWMGAADDSEEIQNILGGIRILIEQVGPRSKDLTEWAQSADPSFDELERHEGKSFWPSETLRKSDEVADRLGIPHADSKEIQAVLKLLKNQWFTRAWTFQESYLARAKWFYRGTLQIPSDELLKVRRCLWTLYSATKDSRFFSTDQTRSFLMLEGMEFWRNSKSSLRYTTLIEQLRLRRGSGCYDKRDIFFSLLGSCEDSTSSTLGIRPNYDESWTYAHLYTEFAFRCIEKQGKLSILRDVGIITPTSDLPSWVPDWSTRRSGNSFTLVGKQVYSCSGSSTAQSVRHSKEPGVLCIQGIQHDVVTDVGRKPTSWHHEEIYEPTREMYSTAVPRTLCADLKLFEESNEESRWDSRSAEIVNRLAEERGSSYTRYLRNSLDRNRRRQLFTTEQGLLGLGPDSIKAKDIIVVAVGGEVPLLLRRAHTSRMENVFSFIGECYVHGIMDGEAFIQARKSAFTGDEDDGQPWLHRLHVEEFPFPLQEFSIV